MLRRRPPVIKVLGARKEDSPVSLRMSFRCVLVPDVIPLLRHLAARPRDGRPGSLAALLLQAERNARPDALAMEPRFKRLRKLFPGGPLNSEEEAKGQVRERLKHFRRYREDKPAWRPHLSDLKAAGPWWTLRSYAESWRQVAPDIGAELYQHVVELCEEEKGYLLEARQGMQTVRLLQIFRQRLHVPAELCDAAAHASGRGDKELEEALTWSVYIQRHLLMAALAEQLQFVLNAPEGRSPQSIYCLPWIDEQGRYRSAAESLLLRLFPGLAAGATWPVAKAILDRHGKYGTATAINMQLRHYLKHGVGTPAQLNRWLKRHTGEVVPSETIVACRWIDTLREELQRRHISDAWLLEQLARYRHHREALTGALEKPDRRTASNS